MKRLALLLLLLAAPAAAQTASTTLTWTAPGDDGAIGRATTYDLRWATTRPDTTSAAAFATWWAAATTVAGLPAPAVSGATQSVTVAPAGGFASGSSGYFVIRTADEAGNWSGYSNVAVRTFADYVAPSPVVDLR